MRNTKNTKKSSKRKTGENMVNSAGKAATGELGKAELLNAIYTLIFLVRLAVGNIRCHLISKGKSRTRHSLLADKYQVSKH